MNTDEYFAEHYPGNTFRFLERRTVEYRNTYKIAAFAWEFPHDPIDFEQDLPPHHLYSVVLLVESKNGSDWEFEMEAQIKWDHCSNWRTGTYIHFCDVSDTQLFPLLYQIAAEHMEMATK